jgi:hypothetical protein
MEQSMSWDHNKYFAKFQVYWERSASCPRDSEQFLMNVAYAIEFMVRGALCKVNPALNASKENESILYAAGITPRTPPITIGIGEGFRRLQRLLPKLSEDVIAKVGALVMARNRELHNDTSDISLLVAKDIMPSVHVLIVETLALSQVDIVSTLGKDEAAQITAVANAINKDRSKRVGDLIRSHKDRFFSLSQVDQGSKRKSSPPGFVSAVLKSGHHIIAQKCPACATMGIIAANPVGRSAPLLRSNELIEEVRVIPTQFECKACDLTIKGLDELMAAGFAHEYTSIDHIDPVEHLNINPEDYIDIENVVREYQRDMHEYQDE